MTFVATPASPFVSRVSAIKAATLNYWRNAIAQAIDGAAGGAYTPSTKIQIAGDGLEINGTGAAAWLKLSSRTVTMRVPLVVVGTSQPVTSSTDGEQTIQLTDVANVHGLKTKNAVATGKYTWLSLGRPPDGNDLASVVIKTKGVGGTAAEPMTQKASYQLIRWAAGTAYETMSAPQADAHSYPGNWQSTAIDTTVTVNAHATIDTSTYEYALLVNHPADAGSGSMMWVYSLTASYTVTTHRVY